jgi:hypothetical protein
MKAQQFLKLAIAVSLPLAIAINLPNPTEGKPMNKTHPSVQTKPSSTPSPTPSTTIPSDKPNAGSGSLTLSGFGKVGDESKGFVTPNIDIVPSNVPRNKSNGGTGS